MTATEILSAPPTHWLAYRMSGFDGLRVVEPVVNVGGGLYAYWHADTWFMIRTERDGTIHDTKDAAAEECRRLNERLEPE